MARTACIDRSTNETQIHLELNLDGEGRATIQTGVGFLDHMLELFTRHAATDLVVHADGDLHVDAHHTVEDVGICLGQAVETALGDKKGVNRYGHATLPMDETLASATIDLSGRACFVYRAELASPKIGDFDSELIEEFWRAFANHARCNLHLQIHYGRNSHHMSEAMFKATARALRTAIEPDQRMPGVPSTKGSL